MRGLLLPLLLLAFSCPAVARSVVVDCTEGQGQVWEDRNGDGHRTRDEPGLPGIKLSDGTVVVVTDAQGGYRLLPVEGRTLFLIKPAGYSLPKRADGLPDFWQHMRRQAGPRLKYGGMPAQGKACRNFGLLRQEGSVTEVLDMLVFSDSQTKSAQDIDYYRRDIVEPLLGKGRHALGTTLGDVVHDDLDLYRQLTQVTTGLGVPWLHIPGNHDLDFDAASDEDSLLTYRRNFGPDTFAWEEPQMVFIGLDDVIYRPGQKPAYVGGLREDQFAFLQAYLPTVPRQRLLVLGMHIPLFNPDARIESFRTADRRRLFALLKDFPHVLILSGHSHSQQHWYHGQEAGWLGEQPLHEYNVGAACGAFWSGAKDAQGIPDSTMADGTPNGYAQLQIGAAGEYRLSWHAARDEGGSGIGLHAPRVLRRDAYPAWGVYANVYMGKADTRVEYRVDGGEWKPMHRVEQADPRLTAENIRDDLADSLRGYDRSPEAEPSTHLWRAALPTDLPVGEHQVEVRAQDHWQGWRTATTTYRLQDATP